jgi:hypothetical protein
VSTCVFYIDEAGNPDGHHIPIRNGETPLFTLAAVAFPLEEWRVRDREFLSLKRYYFPDRMHREGKRDETVEIKGNELTAPRNTPQSSPRKHAFLKGVLSFIPKHSGTCFAVSFLKNPDNPVAATSLYTHALQILVERFSIFIDEHNEFQNGILICDSRSKGLSGDRNLEVIKSHMSFIFGHCKGKNCTNILESPLFGDSKLCAGVQLADIFASVCYANHYQYYLTSKSSREAKGYLDYSHMTQYWAMVGPLFFRAKRKVGGYPMYGMRVINHQQSTQLPNNEVEAGDNLLESFSANEKGNP